MFNFIPQRTAEQLLNHNIAEAALTSDLRVRIRLFIINLVLYLFVLHRELNFEVLCQLAGYTKGSIINWLKKLIADGYSALYDKAKPGRPRELTEDDLAQIKECITDNPLKYGYTVWEGSTIQDFIRINYCIEYSVRHCQRMCREYLNLSLIRPRRYPAKADLFYDQRELFKYKMLCLLEHIAKTDDLLVTQDEAHFKIMTTIMRVWAERGSEPLAYSFDTNESVCLSGFGIVNNGIFFQTEAKIFDHITYITAIREFIAFVKPRDGQKIYIISDNASYHQKAKKLIKENVNGEFDDINKYVVFVYMPPYSPDLNPIELVWRLIRRNVTHNRHFPSLEDLRSAISNFLKKFTNPNETLKNLFDFEYAYDEKVVQKYYLPALLELPLGECDSEKFDMDKGQRRKAVKTHKIEDSAAEKTGTCGRKKGSINKTTAQRREFFNEEGIDPDSNEGSILVKHVKKAEKALVSQNIAPYSAEGKTQLRKVLDDARCELAKRQNTAPCRGRPKSVKVAGREQLIVDAGFELDSPAGKKLNRTLIQREEALMAEGIDPYSPEGKSQLEEFIIANRESFSNVKSKKGVGRPAGSKNKITLNREDFLRSFGVDPNSVEGKILTHQLLAEEKTLQSQGIAPYSDEGKKLLQVSVNTENSTISANAQESDATGPVNPTSIEFERESIIRSMGVDPSSKLGEKLISMLHTAEKRFIPVDDDIYSTKYKEQILDFMNNKLLYALETD